MPQDEKLFATSELHSNRMTLCHCMIRHGSTNCSAHVRKSVYIRATANRGNLRKLRIFFFFVPTLLIKIWRNNGKRNSCFRMSVSSYVYSAAQQQIYQTKSNLKKNKSQIVINSQGLIGCLNCLLKFVFSFNILEQWLTLHKSAPVDKLFGNNNFNVTHHFHI